MYMRVYLLVQYLKVAIALQPLMHEGVRIGLIILLKLPVHFVLFQNSTYNAKIYVLLDVSHYAS